MARPLPTWRCIGYRTSTGRKVPCALTGIVIQGEPGGEERWGQCRLCMDLEAQANKAAYRRNARECRRKLLAYVPDPDGADFESVMRGR